ncbi:DUF4178 domain-containing protein [Bacillus thermotolerans]|uniref:DUF4178 domain-containing protein n=1 Tax=Bacillus thermotolerans TaxID=1221996 RepID=A0A0F5I3E9_BACTR|nr:DUF4178 domain-containing protein [Bacillus thermotolerans]KKB39795.1 hypothetical protein QY95_02012 [Bacillus thermotolerans]KKB44229.1 hypothetical protein QY96_03251 [Bacillus thermotolerans]
MGFFDRLFNRQKETPKVEKRTVSNLRIGDIVTYDLQDYQVVGKLRYNDSGFVWDAYQLQGETGVLWLGVEMDDELELGMYRTVKLPLNEPIPKQVTHDGRKYRLEEHGTAYVKGEGRSQNVHGKEVKYFDFEDESGEHFLSVEVWGSEVEVSYGYTIEEYELKILAGS